MCDSCFISYLFITRWNLCYYTGIFFLYAVGIFEYREIRSRLIEYYSSLEFNNSRKKDLDNNIDDGKLIKKKKFEDVLMKSKTDSIGWKDTHSSKNLNRWTSTMAPVVIQAYSLPRMQFHFSTFPLFYTFCLFYFTLPLLFYFTLP